MPPTQHIDAQLTAAIRVAVRQFVTQKAGLFPSVTIGLAWAIALETVAGEIRTICAQPQQTEMK
ncbi:MAG TPA: hypothetical protein V6C63_02055 [Allocoleopsis sp.]